MKKNIVRELVLILLMLISEDGVVFVVLDEVFLAGLVSFGATTSPKSASRPLFRDVFFAILKLPYKFSRQT